jgi:hypothetical protein
MALIFFGSVSRVNKLMGAGWTVKDVVRQIKDPQAETIADDRVTSEDEIVSEAVEYIENEQQSR